MQRTVKMPDDLDQKIAAEAKRDARPYANMLRILAQEALAARSQAQG